MFTDADFALSLAPVTTEAQLILIPVSEEFGVIAVAKAFGNGKAGCIVFAPAIRLGHSLDGFTPRFLRKIVTSDFALRSGTWSAVGLSKTNCDILRETVAPLMHDLAEIDDEQVEVIDMQQPANTTSSVAVACTSYRADDRTPFEKAIAHLLAVAPSKTKKIA